MSEEKHPTELVRVKFTADLDRDRLDEWLDANFKDEEVEVVDRFTGNPIAFHGESVDYPFICPECARGATGIRAGGGKRVYFHPQADENCEVGMTT